MAHSRQATAERIRRKRLPSYETLLAEQSRIETEGLQKEVSVHCGWGRLLLAHTFPDPRSLVDALLREAHDERDIAIYVEKPHVVLSLAPQQLFLDPSDTFRLWLSHYRTPSRALQGVMIRRAGTQADVEALNCIYRQCRMVPLKADVVLRHRHSKEIIYLVAEDVHGQILGTVMGVNHRQIYGDPQGGSSLWCLAVSPDCHVPGVGEGLVRYLAEYFQVRGCEYMDLSVLHDNSGAKALYEKLGFQVIKTFAVKKKNAINESLFTGPDAWPELNPYARIIVAEAMRRGIQVHVDDASLNLFTLEHGGRRVRCHESLTDLTTAYTMTLCQNKQMTHRAFRSAGLRTPAFTLYQDRQQLESFLEGHQRVVVKPLNGEQGKGISVDLREINEVMSAVSAAKAICDQILLESFHEGEDLRIVVINYEVVAAALRQPAEVLGNGRDTLRVLVKKQSRRRAASTGGESRIPLDDETLRCIRQAGYDWESVLPAGEVLRVRKTANLHTGGTLVDVTAQLHPALVDVARKAARALQIPVVGLDLLVPDPAQPEYVLIEANERPGLDNHAPQPTAERFIDLLFPHTGQEKVAS